MTLLLLVPAASTRETQALSGVLVLLDACVLSVAAVAAARAAFGRPDDGLYRWAAGVFVAASASFLARSALGDGDPAWLHLVPVLSVVLLVAGFSVARLRAGSGWAPDGDGRHPTRL